MKKETEEALLKKQENCNHKWVPGMVGVDLGDGSSVDGAKCSKCGKIVEVGTEEKKPA